MTRRCTGRQSRGASLPPVSLVARLRIGALLVQQSPDDLSLIRANIGSAYGPADAPHWGFVQSRHASAPYAALLQGLRARLYVLDDTDLNSDVGLWLTLSSAPGLSPQWCLCLSYVGPYSVFFRVPGPPLTDGAPDLLPLELFVLTALREHGLQLLAQDLLERPCPMTGLTNNPVPSEVLIFHVLFSDTTHLPWRT
jgi:hypothetical protein